MPKPRFLKTKVERLAGTLDYCDNNLTLAEAQEIAAVVENPPHAQGTALAKLPSLGATGKSADRAANREAGRAKPALVMATWLFHSGYRQGAGRGQSGAPASGNVGGGSARRAEELVHDPRRCDVHYTSEGGFNNLQRTATAFWETFPPDER